MPPAPAPSPAPPPASAPSRRLGLSVTGPAGFLLLWTAWTWSGLRTAWLWPSVAAGALLLGVTFARGRDWRKSPAFYLGGLFLLYLLVQWFNAGRALYLDVGLNKWVHSPPRFHGWPFAFNRGEAAQMLFWFFPAWGLITALRESALSRRATERLFLTVVYASGALAVLGILQFLSGTDRMYWLAPMRTTFFATFGYTNHAAAYFLTVAALACGYLYHEAFHPLREAKRGRATLLALSACLCAIAANLSLSRAGIILSWAFILFCLWAGLSRGLTRFRPAAKFNLAFLAAGIVLALFMAVVGMADGGIREEFEVRDPDEVSFLPKFLQRFDLSPRRNRYELAMAAVRIWRAHPRFGVGGWGFRHLLAFHVPEHDWHYVVIRSGRANVHNDYLQFLAEFGAVGFGLGMVAVPVALWFGVWRARKRPRRELTFSFAVLALGVPLVFATWDLPFRCPAILYLWCAILAGLPSLSASHGAPVPVNSGR